MGSSLPADDVSVDRIDGLNNGNDQATHVDNVDVTVVNNEVVNNKMNENSVNDVGSNVVNNNLVVNEGE